MPSLSWLILAYLLSSGERSRAIMALLSKKIRLDVSGESFARQRIHMKNQGLFSLKFKSEKLKCPLLQFLLGALRVNLYTLWHPFEIALMR